MYWSCEDRIVEMSAEDDAFGSERTIGFEVTDNVVSAAAAKL